MCSLVCICQHWTSHVAIRSIKPDKLVQLIIQQIEEEEGLGLALRGLLLRRTSVLFLGNVFNEPTLSSDSLMACIRALLNHTPLLCFFAAAAAPVTGSPAFAQPGLWTYSCSHLRKSSEGSVARASFVSCEDDVPDEQDEADGYRDGVVQVHLRSSQSGILGRVKTNKN